MQATSNPTGTGMAGLHDLLARAVQEERARISRELHDELLQALFVLRLDCQYLESHLEQVDEARSKVRSMQSTLESVSTSLRRVVAGLRPAPLDHSFTEAIHSLTRQFTASSGIACGVSIDEGVETREPRASAAYRLVQEALHNVRKHANAQHVSVQIEKRGGTLRVAVRDDGSGFDASAPRRGGGMGLDGMQERVRSLHGDLIVVSAPSRGTTVEARLPAERPPHALSKTWARAGQGTSHTFALDG
jgi:signal transduction histidine kinase